MHKLSLKSSVLIGACAISLLAMANSSFAQKDSVTLDYFSDIGFGEGVAVVQHPAGEYRNGKTYVSFQGPEEDPYVASYDHKSGEWKGPYRAGISELGKTAEALKNKPDSHGKPTMLIDKLGYIHIFYGGHGGWKNRGKNPLGDSHSGSNKHAVSLRPYDVSAWQDLDNISPNGTYNQVIMMDNGDIYLFYRHGAHRSNWVYQKSTDNGRTFEAPISFLKTRRRSDVAANDSWYAWAAPGKNGDIIISYDYHFCWDREAAPDERGHHGERHNVYYMVFNPEKNSWRNIKGQDVAIPVTRDVADEMTKIFESDELWSFNQSSALDAEGNPHIGIAMGPDSGVRHGGPKSMRHFRWTGSQWVGGHDAGMPDGRGDIQPVSADKVSFLISSRDKKGFGNVSWWDSVDGGENFKRGKTLFQKKGRNFSTSAFVKNAHPDARIIVAENAPRDSKFRNMYLIGDKGAVKRKVVIKPKSVN